MTENRIEIGGPYFEDFQVGKFLEEAPSMTITQGHAVFHQALFADRLRLPLDHHLTQAISGQPSALVNPGLLCNMAIGQTTYATQRVKANLFYRGLIIKRPVFIGDSLYTTTKVVALKQNKIKPGRAATGLVVLEMRVANQNDEEVILFWRCPMIPCRDKAADTGKSDSFDAIPTELDMDAVIDAVPQNWNFELFREKFQGNHFQDIQEGSAYLVHPRDTVTSAPELVRMTLNMATTHTDAPSSVYNKRLVYGGHTIAMAGAQITRALPNLMNIIAWRSCDHIAPVFEDDILRTEIKIVKKHPLEKGGLVDINAVVYAERGEEAPEPGKDIQVLDWNLIGLMA